MAEALGVASSILQVAETGFKLYQTLNAYVRDVKDADKHVKRLTGEVHTTAWALQQLGSLLNEDDEVKLYKPEAIHKTATALKECEDAFKDVDLMLGSFLSTPMDGAAVTISVSARLKWPLKKAKIEPLLAHLERLKTTLLLVFKVLSYASRIASKAAQKDNQFLDDRLQLQLLIKAEREAAEKERRIARSTRPSSPDRGTGEELPRSMHQNFGTSQKRTVSDGRNLKFDSLSSQTLVDNDLRDIDQSRDVSFLSGSSVGSQAQHFFVGAAMLGNTFTSEPAALAASVQSSELSKARKPQTRRTAALINQLERCAAAVSRLATAVEDETSTLRATNGFDLRIITSSFRETRRAVEGLTTAEVNADSEDSDDTASQSGLESEEVDLSFLQGRRVNQAGLVIGDEGVPVARLVEGSVREIANNMIDEYGQIRNMKGKVIGRVQSFPDEERVSKPEGPFAGLEGLRVIEGGKVADEDGNVVGEIIEGNIKRLLGLAVDEDGDVVDKYGNVKGYARPLPEEEEQIVATRVPTENMRPGVTESTLSPPFRSQGRNRMYAKSNSYAGLRPSPLSVLGHGQSPPLQPQQNATDNDSLAPFDNTPASRPPSPARGRNGDLGARARCSSNASDLRDYILDLANLDCTSSNGADPKQAGVQKNPATFQCTLCPKRFTRAFNLRSHLRTHTDKREPDGPFAGFNGLRVQSDSTITNDNGEIVGRITEGTIPSLVGQPVDESGDIVNENGNVIGKAERWEPEEKCRIVNDADADPPVHKSSYVRAIASVTTSAEDVADEAGEDAEGIEDQLPGIEALEGKELTEAGEVVDEQGNVLGAIEDPDVREKIGSSEIDPSTLKINEEGQVVDEDGKVLVTGRTALPADAAKLGRTQSNQAPGGPNDSHVNTGHGDYRGRREQIHRELGRASHQEEDIFAGLDMSIGELGLDDLGFDRSTTYELISAECGRNEPLGGPARSSSSALDQRDHDPHMATLLRTHQQTGASELKRSNVANIRSFLTLGEQSVIIPIRSMAHTEPEIERRSDHKPVKGMRGFRQRIRESNTRHRDTDTERMEKPEFERRHNVVPKSTDTQSNVNADEDYRRRMEQVQREVGRVSSEDRLTKSFDLDREQRRRERDVRRRERKFEREFGKTKADIGDTDETSEDGDDIDAVDALLREWTTVAD